MTQPFPPPNEAPELWDKLQILGVLDVPLISPGTCVISGNDREIPLDVKEAQGQRGASTERKDEKLKKFTSTFTITDDEWPEGSAVAPPGTIVTDFWQWPAWEQALLISYGGDDAKALGVYHPDLARQDIVAAVVTKIGGMARNEDGSGVIAVEWHEFREPEPIKGGVGAAKPDSPENRTDADDEIDRLIKEIDRLQEEGKNL
jgi:hypothetical protein